MVDRKVYVLDSRACKRELEIKPTLNVVFRSVVNLGGRRPKNNVAWDEIESPQQPGGVECGYYVMRYMYEICTLYSDFEHLDTAFDAKPYSQEQIDEICEVWSKYFIEECI
ncbi:PREDICTED: uncharacterized protein LOC109152138 [Ipomoea nil]|uniref:uncharacterized protein LOC109152138 n=1 Tax=Ipomoea nil TaxID=35883 RepID=UPI0009013A61|nr:PREDICTED: uncharacterized protein LOC109152138 [Ipomoea nil]